MMDAAKRTRFGLGTARLRSSSGLSARQASNFLRRALEAGVRFFDTSSMYGQGDAERTLGWVLESSHWQDVVICTKGGYRTRRALLLRCVKPVIRPFVRARAKTRTMALPRSRDGFRTRILSHLVQDFEFASLATSLRGSLNRLRRPSVDYYLLHDPPPELFLNGSIGEFMCSLVSDGSIGSWGVGTSDLGSISACLDRCSPGIVQTAVNRGNLRGVVPILEECRDRGVSVVANSVLVDSDRTHRDLLSLYRLLLESQIFDVILSGTTSLRHLEMNLSAFEAAGGSIG